MSTSVDCFDTDVAIIGSGPAGSIAAFELTRLGYDVVVLERGGHHPADPLHLGQPKYGWDSEVLVAKAPSDAGTIQPTMPTLVGGGGEVYAAASHRFLPQDFRLQSESRICDAGGDVRDWPFSYDDLEPFYTRVEQLIGVSGDSSNCKHPTRRSARYPLPPLDLKAEVVDLFDSAATKLGLHSHPTPLAILSKPYQGRRACVECGFCVGQSCAYASKGSPTVTTLRWAIETGRCRVIADAHAHRLLAHDRRATQVEFSTGTGRRHLLAAKVFLVACGALFSPRLLFLSRSTRFPDGIGNHSGVLGRFLCSHVITLVYGRFARNVYPANTHYVLRSIDDYYFVDSPLWKGGVLQLHLTGGFDTRFPDPPDVPFGHALRQQLMRPHTNRPAIYYCGDAVPQSGNRALLSDALDRFGFPQVRIEHRFHPVDRLAAEQGRAHARSIFATMGAEETTSSEDLDWRSGFHYSGTCRSGKDPKESVVNPVGLVHGTTNVYVCDASIFPTSGGFNPALTVQASALRIAAHVGASGMR